MDEFIESGVELGIVEDEIVVNNLHPVALESVLESVIHVDDTDIPLNC